MLNRRSRVNEERSIARIAAQKAKIPAEIPAETIHSSDVSEKTLS